MPKQAVEDHTENEPTNTTEYTPPDGAAAFDLADHLGDDLSQIEHLVAALRLIANSDECTDAASALCAVIRSMRGVIRDAQEKQEKIWSLTWGYVFSRDDLQPLGTEGANE